MRAKIRPDLVIEGGPMEGLIECKGITTCPTRYKSGWGPRSTGWTPVERRAAVEVKDRMAAVDAIDQEQHPRVRPPPLRKRVDQLGGLRVAVVGGFCEYNDTVHEFVQAAAEAIAARNRSRSGGTYRQRVAAVRLRLRRQLAVGGWADWHRAIIARLPVVQPSASQAQSLMERRARADGETTMRCRAAVERRREADRRTGRKAAGRSNRQAATAATAEGQGGQATAAAAVAKARTEEATDGGAEAEAEAASGRAGGGQNRMTQEGKEAQGAVAAAKSKNYNAAPTGDDEPTATSTGSNHRGHQPPTTAPRAPATTTTGARQRRRGEQQEATTGGGSATDDANEAAAGSDSGEGHGGAQRGPLGVWRGGKLWGEFEAPGGAQGHHKGGEGEAGPGI